MKSFIYFSLSHSHINTPTSELRAKAQGRWGNKPKTTELVQGKNQGKQHGDPTNFKVLSVKKQVTEASSCILRLDMGNDKLTVNIGCPGSMGYIHKVDGASKWEKCYASVCVRFKFCKHQLDFIKPLVKVPKRVWNFQSAHNFFSSAWLTKPVKTGKVFYSGKNTHTLTVVAGPSQPAK